MGDELKAVILAGGRQAIVRGGQFGEIREIRDIRSTKTEQPHD